MPHYGRPAPQLLQPREARQHRQVQLPLHRHKQLPHQQLALADEWQRPRYLLHLVLEAEEQQLPVRRLLPLRAKRALLLRQATPLLTRSQQRQKHSRFTARAAAVVSAAVPAAVVQAQQRVKHLQPRSLVAALVDERE